jgi:GNAT superfamily N-acetyltransferase
MTALANGYYELRPGRLANVVTCLEMRERPNCELESFGLAPEAVGMGAGATLMDAAIDFAFAQPIGRFWVHTCTFDHPNALGFHRRSGFTPYKMMVEVHDDPRLSGHLPREASPQVPLLDP